MKKVLLFVVLIITSQIATMSQSVIKRDQNKDVPSKTKSKTITIEKDKTEVDDQVELGFNYFFGQGGMPKDISKGLDYLTKAATKNNAEAMTLLGDIYSTPESGVPVNYTYAASLYKKAADLGRPDAMTTLGTMYRDGIGVNKDINAAIRLFLSASKQDYPEAYYHLGKASCIGEGITQNNQQACNFYKKAVELGYLPAFVSLGDCYVHGIGVNPDYSKAIDLYQQVADKIPDAAYNLAVLYETGPIEVRNLQKALELYQALDVQYDMQNDIDRIQSSIHEATAVQAENISINFTNTPKIYKVGNVTFKMIPVEGGSFTMGPTSNFSKENPSHSVVLSSFYIAETEVTQKLWEEVMGYSIKDNFNRAKKSEPYSSLYGVGANNPMYYISWNECQLFIKRLNEKTGGHFRMPTEAEWEYAALGGKSRTNTLFSGSDDAYEVGWFVTSNKNGGINPEKTHAVGKKKPNELGIYDMSGNVGEWCQDWMGEYPSNDMENPRGPQNGIKRVWRGGNWGYFPPTNIKERFSNSPDALSCEIGLRLAE